MKEEMPTVAAELGLRFHTGPKVKAKEDLKKLRKRLKTLQAQQQIVFAHGKGQRKSILQRAVEAVEQYLTRQKGYDDYNHSFGERSDSRTLIPMLKKLQGLGYTKPVADAGFESEENYTWCEENGK